MVHDDLGLEAFVSAAVDQVQLDPQEVLAQPEEDAVVSELVVHFAEEELCSAVCAAETFGVDVLAE